MIEEHPTFKQPTDVDIPIWRYVDFTKFVDLLERRSLYFSRADRLGDPFEGSTPRADVDERARRLEKTGWPTEVVRSLSRNESGPMMLQQVVVNCWHMNHHESAAMWKLYLKSDEGIAIRSTYKRLKTCLQPCTDKVYLATVKYIDYETERMPSGNLFEPFAHKRKSFEHEQELRAVIAWPEGPTDGTSISMPAPEGVRVPVDLDELIEAVIVSPAAPLWLAELVCATCNRYELRAEVRSSSLSKDPIY